jgi:NADP-dependent 3-hydroxy acid dehydrogenase YdfG
VLAVECAGTGIRTTLVSPSATDTTLWDRIDRVANPNLPSREAMLRPEAVADAVLFAVTQPAHVNVDVIEVSSR